MIKLDKTDKKIIEHLIKDARTPLSEIAKGVRLSKSSTHNRLNNLIKKEIITGFVPIVDFIKAGYTIRLVFIKLNFSDETIKKLESLDFCLGLSTNSSFNNMIFTSISRDPKEFREQLSQLYKITKYDCIKILSVLKYDTPNYNLFGIKTPSKNKGDGTLAKIDKTDIKILKALEKNARTPSIQIASTLGIDIKTVINRIRKMERCEFIKTYHTTFNSSKIGLHPYNILFKIKQKENIERLYKFIQNQDLCYLITQVDGEYDLVGTFVSNYGEIKQFLTVLKQNFEEVETEVMMLFEFKNNFMPKKVMNDINSPI